MIKEAKISTKARQILANNIVYYRIKNNWSQEYFAELLGTSSGYVSEMENDKRNISIDYIDQLASIFKIEPHEILSNSLTVSKILEDNSIFLYKDYGKIIFDLKTIMDKKKITISKIVKNNWFAS